MRCEDSMQTMDHGGHPYVMNMDEVIAHNKNFRTAVWTGCYVQMTVMCIPPCGEIGLEQHNDTEQIIRIEEGKALVRMGTCECKMDFEKTVCKGDVIFIPVGVWHNIKNIQTTCPLKVSSIYAPPHHKKGTIEPKKCER